MTAAEGDEVVCYSCQIRMMSHDSGFGDSLPFEEPEGDLEDGPGPDYLQGLIPGIRIGEKIGRGGMGIVYLGEQETLGRQVAVKLLPPLSSSNQQLADRLRLEARAMARLDHEHVVRIHDAGNTNQGLLYIVMEFVDGRTLRQLIAEGCPEPKEALELAAQICDGLHYAHGEGIVHRDMKPSNVLLSRTGRAKIADFGLAKVAGPLHVERLTRTHQLLGTPLYMAPEQTNAAKSVDHRADVYAVGIILHELLTGEMPGSDHPLPSRAAPIDSRLDAVVARALRENPEERWDSADELAGALRHIAASWRGPSRTRQLLRRFFGSSTAD